VRRSILIAALALAAPALAQEEPPEEEELNAWGWVEAVAGHNPPALSSIFSGFLRYTYERSEDDPLFEELYLQVGASIEPNPAWTQASIQLEAVPLAPFRLRLRYDVYAFYGSSGALLSFPDADAPFGRRARDALDGEEEAGMGQRVLFQPTLRLKLGPVVVANQCNLAYYFLPGKGPYLLELEWDTLLKEDADGLVANRSSILFELWDGDGEASLLLGPQYEVVRSFQAGVTRQRVGGLLYFIPVEELGPVEIPWIWVWAGYTLQDRNRRDEGFVLAGVGFDFGRLP
jgi:hypothetical protein